MPEHARTAAGFVTIPALDVALHVVRLPVRGAAERLRALPFALEDMLGRPLEDVHCALLGRAGDDGWLAACVSAERMRAVCADAPAGRLVPETLLLPPPDPAAGPAWSVWCDGPLALVRAQDGTGFAAATDMLPGLWQAAGRPDIAAAGPRPLSDLGIGEPGSAPPVPSLAASATGDLRQGAFAPVQRLRAPLVAAIAVLGLGLAAHVGLAQVDLARKTALAASLRAEAGALLADAIPGATADSDPVVLHRRIAALGATGDGFLPTVQAAAGSLPEGSGLTLSALDWSSEARALTLQAEAPDLDALQSVEVALRDSGLRVDAGAATAGQGSARMTLTVGAVR